MEWRMAKDINYQPKTNFWDMFTEVEPKEEKIKQLAETLFKKYENDYKALTELVMVINHKSWEHSNHNTVLSILYSNLYYKYDQMAMKVLDKNKETIEYYFKTLD